MILERKEISSHTGNSVRQSRFVAAAMASSHSTSHEACARKFNESRTHYNNISVIDYSSFLLNDSGQAQ